MSVYRHGTFGSGGGGRTGGAILDLTSMHDLGLSSLVPFPIIVQVGLIWAQTMFQVQNRKKKWVGYCMLTIFVKLG